MTQPISTSNNLATSVSSLPARIVVGGTTGSGKTTLGRRLAAITGAPHIELDSLYHGPNWTEMPDFRERVDELTSEERWVVDGNYGTVRDLTWGRADLMVWLDYSMARIMSQLLPRIFRRGLRREELWNGNRENIINHFATRQSLILWAFQTHWKKRRSYPAEFAAFPRLAVIRMTAPNDVERWLASVAARQP